MERSSSSKSGNIRVTSISDASGGGGITYLDYSRAHVMRPEQMQCQTRSSFGGPPSLLPVEDVGTEDRREIMVNGGRLGQAAEICRNARDICVQSGHGGAERAARDAVNLIDRIASSTFRKS
jgi:hypothetical protein